MYAMKAMRQLFMPPLANEPKRFFGQSENGKTMNLTDLFRATESTTVVRAITDTAKVAMVLFTILWIIHMLTKRKDK